MTLLFDQNIYTAPIDGLLAFEREQKLGTVSVHDSCCGSRNKIEAQHFSPEGKHFAAPIAFAEGEKNV